MEKGWAGLPAGVPTYALRIQAQRASLSTTATLLVAFRIDKSDFTIIEIENFDSYS